MGNKTTKISLKSPKKLCSKDISFLTKQTGMNKEEILVFFEKFIANNPDGFLNKKEFAALYESLRPETMNLIDDLVEHIFKAFDADSNGKISFKEFLIGYAITSRGDQYKKLEYAFEVYDVDNSGYLDEEELNAGIYGMLDMLGVDRKVHDSHALAKECLSQLDKSHDGKISKEEFIEGLLSNYSLRALMSPFN